MIGLRGYLELKRLMHEHSVIKYSTFFFNKVDKKNELISLMNIRNCIGHRSRG